MAVAADLSNEVQNGFPWLSLRMVSCATDTVLVLSGTAVALTLYAPDPYAFGTQLFSRPFNDNTVDGPAGSVSLPAVQSGTNPACLTAAGNPTANPLASRSTATDTQGSGTLRLTSVSGDGAGAAFAGTSISTAHGLDVTFNSYQHGGIGADGIAFVLAAVNPAGPQTPATAGLSVSATSASAELRITTLSEVNGPPEPGVTTQPPTPAQLCVINPATPTTTITITDGQAVTVENLSVDPPADVYGDGGLDTTLTIPLPGGSLAPGASVSIAMSFSVDRHGPYWFGYDVDAITGPTFGPVRRSPGPPASRPVQPAPLRHRIRNPPVTRHDTW